LREIIRRAIEDDKVLALGARDISLPFVPAEVTDFSVDSVCTVADIEAARTAIIRAIPALEGILVSLAAAGNILGKKNDDELTAQELREKYDTEEGWGQHPRFTMEDWRNEVSNEDTRIGYWDWVEKSLAYAEDEEESANDVPRPGVGESACRFCEKADCNYSRDESQAGGFNNSPTAEVICAKEFVLEPDEGEKTEDVKERERNT
jgi:hypothetical protein